jgi:ligand-binding sensor domain-containing protein
MSFQYLKSIITVGCSILFAFISHPMKSGDNEYTVFRSKNSVSNINIVGSAVYVSTYNGLFILDTAGNVQDEFNDLDGLPSSNIRCTLFGNDSTLWVGTASGLIAIKNQTLRNLDHLDLAFSTEIRALSTDEQHNIWIASASGLIKYSSDDSWEIITVDEGLIDDDIQSISGIGNELWVHTPSGISVLSGDTIINISDFQGFPAGKVRKTIVDSSGILWFATWGDGLIKYNGSSYDTINTSDGIISNNIHDIAVGSQGELWVANNGISIINDHEITNLRESDGLISDLLRVIEVDKSNQVWLGFGQAGIMKYSSGQWSHFPLGGGIPDNTVTAVWEDAQGRIWFGTPHGASVVDGILWKSYGIYNGLKSGAIQDIVTDDSFQVWFSTSQGLSVLNPDEEWNYFTSEEGLTSDQQTSIYYGQNKLWAGSASDGISIIENGVVTGTITNLDGLPDNRIRSITGLGDSMILVSTFGGGLAMLNEGGWSVCNVDSGMSGNNIVSAAMDQRRGIWAGIFYDGVDYYNGNTWTHYSTGNYLANDVVNKVVVTRDSMVWICHMAGVNRFDGQSWEHMSQGLSNNAVNDLCLDSRGTIWFATSGGITKFGPEPPRIERIRVSPDNRFADIIFTEPVYSGGIMKDPINAGDLLPFVFPQENGLKAKIKTIGKPVNDPSGSDTLRGGETSVRVFLQYTGSTTGEELLTFVGAKDSSVNDHAMNYLSANEYSAFAPLNYLPSREFFIDTVICESDLFFAGGEYQQSSGTYFDTLNTSFGYDSILITHLVINPVPEFGLTVEICEGESYYAGGRERELPGVYTDTLQTMRGCDSIVVTNLEVFPHYELQVDVSIPPGQTYIAGGMAQSEAGIYFDSLQSIYGCDSLVITNLEVTAAAGISESHQSQVHIYPNPSRGIMFINCDELRRVDLYDSAGNILRSFFDAELDLSFLDDGTYYIRIITKTGRVIRKIVFLSP